jgi:hypothetical protein
MMASRAGVIGIFSAIGFAIGFLAFLASPAVGNWIAEVLPNLRIDQSIVFATLCGAIGAVASTVTVTAWAKRA